MKLVLSVSAIGEQAEGRCPWMWIDLSPPLAQKAHIERDPGVHPEDPQRHGGPFPDHHGRFCSVS